MHYGPYSPGEKELKVIGDVSGLDALELGCGGGQISIVMKKWGAKSVMGVDQSDEQIVHAQQLAITEKVEVSFVRHDIEDLSFIKDESIDLIVSTHALNYVESIQSVFEESSRVLRVKGRLVICMGHPISHLIWNNLETKSIDNINSYFKIERETWEWEDQENEPIAEFETTAYRFEQIINGLITAGLTIECIVEPPAYTLEQIRRMDKKDIPYHDEERIDHQFVKINQIIPFSLIVSAKKH
jgi:ubiquinone/menaquinone biosynthesis C-methylase UbiE